MKIGERGQVTIPKELRNRYGLKPHVEVDFVPEPDGLKLRKRRSRDDAFRHLRGLLKGRRVIQNVDDYVRQSRGR
jgi:AbrB family looped-hinge helix DNA binding protein